MRLRISQAATDSQSEFLGSLRLSANMTLSVVGMCKGSGYIHDCRISSDTKRLFSRQPFPMSKNLYTRLSLIKYKSVIYTAAVSHTKKFIYTAAVHKV